ncbi:MAG: SDR family oxidoreductase [Planctomycetia bacterium]|nr:SDR family oxidoreductase [Planctomycetia bacterium]
MRLLVTGASGQLGAYLLRELDRTDWQVTAWSGKHGSAPSQPVNLTDRDAVTTAFRAARPEVVLHAAALSSVAECQRDPERAERVNVAGTRCLAELAAATQARLLLVSTDLVFDGRKGNYTEADAPAPLSVYGRTKQAAEQAVLATPGSLVARLSLLFGPSLIGRAGFFDQQVQALRAGQPLTLFDDERRTPLDYPTAARALMALAAASCTGLLHVGGGERLSRVEMGRRVARTLSVDPGCIVAQSRLAAPAPEPRPADTSLDTSRFRSLFPELRMPSFDEALRQLLGA